MYSVAIVDVHNLVYFLSINEWVIFKERETIRIVSSKEQYFLGWEILKSLPLDITYDSLYFLLLGEK